MPFYCYSDESGCVEERFFRMGKAPEFIVLDNGSKATRDFAAEHSSRRSVAWNPIECIASGVPAQQAGELREFYKKHGEIVEVSSRGNPVYTSAQQRKRLLKLRGLHDNDSYS
jgi:hypothetical protein